VAIRIGEESMRAVVQRVSSARVVVDGETTGEIGRGFLVLLGVAASDGDEDLRWLVDKVVGLRVFNDAEGKMNLALAEVGGEMLVVSQFTLLGDCRKGRRPSFIDAAPPEMAERMYDQFVAAVQQRGIRTETGRFRTHMDVQLVNDGPVTLVIDSAER
jgi:D-tyrosyl-tRNA(Tyr) deacylase